MINPEVHGIGYQQGPRYQSHLSACVFHRDDYQCRYCGHKSTPGNRLTKDHVIPVSAMGPTRRDNLVAACYACNQAKGNKPIAVFLADQPDLLKEIQAQLLLPLAGATPTNVIISQLLKHLETQDIALTQTCCR